MALTITDTFETLSGVQIAGQVVTAKPSYAPLFISGIERDTSRAITTTTNSSGAWTLALPDPSICDPSSVQWYVTLPDNTVWKGAVPTGVSGPLTIKQLKDSYSWGLVQAGYPAPTAAAAIAGGVVFASTTITANYTVALTDWFVIVNAAGLTVTLPSAATAGAGKWYVIKNGPSGASTSIASASGTIDGTSTSTQLSTPYQSVNAVSDGSNWFLW